MPTAKLSNRFTPVLRGPKQVEVRTMSTPLQHRFLKLVLKQHWKELYCTLCLQNVLKLTILAGSPAQMWKLDAAGRISATVQNRTRSTEPCCCSTVLFCAVHWLKLRYPHCPHPQSGPPEQNTDAHDGPSKGPKWGDTNTQDCQTGGGGGQVLAGPGASPRGGLRETW
jgi:hypothetical protein